MGLYICYELADMVRSHVGGIEDHETFSVDMFHAVCCFLCDEEMRGLFSAKVKEAEDALAPQYVMREWIGDEFEVYAEDGVERVDFVRGDVWDALKATPFANYNVSLVYDRDSGCYSKPLNKIYRVDYDDGTIVRVALRSATSGVVLSPTGNKSEDSDLFSALWNNPPHHYAANARSKKQK